MLSISGHFVFSGRVGGAEQMFYNLLNGFFSNGTDITLLCSDENNFDPTFVRRLVAANVKIIANNPEKGFISEQISAFSPSLNSDGILFPNYFTPPFVSPRLGRVTTVIHDFLYAEPWNIMSPQRRAWQRMSYWLTYLRADP